MYAVVAYDADSFERANIRSLLMPQLHWIQNSIFAGELTRTAAKDLHDSLKEKIETARITLWLFDRKPEVYQLGEQDDEESIFI